MGFRLAGGGRQPAPTSELRLGDVQARELCSQLLLWSRVAPIMQREGSCAQKSAP